MSGKIPIQPEENREIFISLGSNMGNRHEHLMNAIGAIEENIGRVLARSDIYETEAWGKKDQDDFLNMVIEVASTHDEMDVLKKMLSIEADMGRERSERWSPRIIDLDLLFYGQRKVKSANLTLPHPEIQNRHFVLRPMTEIAPKFIHPVFQQSMQYLSTTCKDTSTVRRYPS